MMGICLPGEAQNPYIKHYTTSHGLPSNTIYQIYQDSHKFLWFASDAGVVKFDGATFTSYRKKDGLSSNDVVRLKEDSEGRIWFFNYNSSVNYFRNDTIYNANKVPFLNQFMGMGFILDFMTGPDKSIHFFNWQREVFTLDKNNQVKKEILLESIRSVRRNTGPDISQIRIHLLGRNSRKDWVIWSSIGIYSQDPITGKMAVIDSSLHCSGVFPARHNTSYVLAYNKIVKVDSNFVKEEVPFAGNPQNIKTIIEDQDGHLWIAAFDEGVYCYSGNRMIKHFDIKECHGLLQDHENNIWISTRNDGIYAINHDLLNQKHIENDHFNGQGLKRLFLFPETGLWATNSSSVVLLKNNTIVKTTLPTEVQPVNLLYYFQNKSLLISSLHSKACLLRGVYANLETRLLGYTDSFIFMHPMKKIISDKNRKQIASYEQEFLLVAPAVDSSVNLSSLKVAERINNIFYNSRNELVINSRRNYLFKDKKLEHYPLLSRFDGTVITDYIAMNDSTELFIIENDSIYLLQNNKFFNLNNGFNVPVTLPIRKVVYHNPILYIATIRDIIVCHDPLKIIQGRPLHLEPLNISFNYINDILVNDDTLYIASDDGLTVVAESTIAKSVSNPPLPYLKSILINDARISSPESGITFAGNNKIQLSFGCISYFTGSVVYSYMLEGSEDVWTTGTGSEINIVYQNLPKGRYIFKLRVRKSNSDWSNPLELPITVKPTMYESPFFWALVVLVVAIIVFLITARLRSQKMKRVEIDHELVLMEQRALQSMMNPHFIFNSLGSIQNYLLKNKGNEAVIYLSNFARLIRQNLNAISSPMIPLSEEVNRLRTYLDLEKKRLENKFDYSIHIDKKFEEDEIFLPSMIVQPFAENSIWHGLASVDIEGSIMIGFYRHNNKSIRIIIEDNGVGIDKSVKNDSTSSHKKRLGMQIIRKRLDLLSKKYKTPANIVVSDSCPGNAYPGTRVEIIVPYLNEIGNNPPE